MSQEELEPQAEQQQPDRSPENAALALSDRRNKVMAQLQRDLGVLPTSTLYPPRQRIDWLPIAIPCGLCFATGVMMMIVANNSIHAASQPRENEALMARTIAEMGAKMQEQRPTNVCILSLGCGQPNQEESKPQEQHQTPLQEVVARQGAAIDSNTFQSWLVQWRAMPDEALARYEQSPPSECNQIPSACLALQAVINERKPQQQ